MIDQEQDEQQGRFTVKELVKVAAILFVVAVYLYIFLKIVFIE